MSGRFEVGVAIFTPDGHCQRTTIDEPRQFTGQPCAERIDGLPLASLQLDEQGRYIAQLSAEDRKAFWAAHFGRPLRTFAADALGLS